MPAAVLSLTSMASNSRTSLHSFRSGQRSWYENHLEPHTAPRSDRRIPFVSVRLQSSESIRPAPRYSPGSGTPCLLASREPQRISPNHLGHALRPRTQWALVCFRPRRIDPVRPLSFFPAPSSARRLRRIRHDALSPALLSCRGQRFVDRTSLMIHRLRSSRFEQLRDNEVKR
jgi:hypothetical protein